MTHTLRIQIRDSDGAVLRALGLIERRCYRLRSCVIGEADDGGRTMDVNVSSSRPGDLLKRQLERLHDVMKVELQPAAVADARHSAIRPLGRRN